MKHSVVVALYDDLEDARDAVEELRDHGFSSNDISIVAHDLGGEYARELEMEDTTDVDDVGAAEGAGLGAIAGGLTGLLVSVSALAIPGIGPVVAAGPLISTLVGAGVGAATGGIVAAMVDLGIPEDEAEYYAEGVRRGGTMVTVQATGDMVDEAVDILDAYDPVDVERRASSWQERGWERFSISANPYTEEELEDEYGYYVDAYDDEEDEEWTAVVVYIPPEEQ